MWNKKEMCQCDYLFPAVYSNKCFPISSNALRLIFQICVFFLLFFVIFFCYFIFTFVILFLVYCWYFILLRCMRVMWECIYVWDMVCVVCFIIYILTLSRRLSLYLYSLQCSILEKIFPSLSFLSHFLFFLKLSN